jgi:hypothetical protein
MIITTIIIHNTIDKDGTMDFIFPVCYPIVTCAEVNSIYIVYNYQTPMCASITGTGDDCTSSGSICGIQNGFSIPNMDIVNSTTVIFSHIQINISSLLNGD